MQAGEMPIGQRGPRDQRRRQRRPTPHGTHIPSDAPAGPTPAHRRRRTQLHTKTQCGEAGPPREEMPSSRELWR